MLTELGELTTPESAVSEVWSLIGTRVCDTLVTGLDDDNNDAEVDSAEVVPSASGCVETIVAFVVVVSDRTDTSLVLEMVSFVDTWSASFEMSSSDVRSEVAEVLC